MFRHSRLFSCRHLPNSFVRQGILFPWLVVRSLVPAETERHVQRAAVVNLVVTSSPDYRRSVAIDVRFLRPLANLFRHASFRVQDLPPVARAPLPRF